jgi:pimeloyl-ACP methyl ester carboxylesterase
MPQGDDALFYQLYFQTPGLAEAELERDVRLTTRSVLYSGSGDAPVDAAAIAMVPRSGGFLSGMRNPASLPPWLAEADVDFYAGEFERGGYRGGLNWYRNMDRNWELMAPFAGARVAIPALYLVGDRDLVLHFRGMDQLVANLSSFVPKLQETILLPGCGHWTQQERASEVNAAMIDFLRRL